MLAQSSFQVSCICRQFFFADDGAVRVEIESHRGILSSGTDAGLALSLCFSFIHRSRIAWKACLIDRREHLFFMSNHSCYGSIITYRLRWPVAIFDNGTAFGGWPKLTRSEPSTPRDYFECACSFVDFSRFEIEIRAMQPDWEYEYVCNVHNCRDCVLSDVSYQVENR